MESLVLGFGELGLFLLLLLLLLHGVVEVVSWKNSSSQTSKNRRALELLLQPYSLETKLVYFVFKTR